MVHTVVLWLQFSLRSKTLAVPVVQNWLLIVKAFTKDSFSFNITWTKLMFLLGKSLHGWHRGTKLIPATTLRPYCVICMLKHTINSHLWFTVHITSSHCRWLDHSSLGHKDLGRVTDLFPSSTSFDREFFFLFFRDALYLCLAALWEFCWWAIMLLFLHLVPLEDLLTTCLSGRKVFPDRLPPCSC